MSTRPITFEKACEIVENATACILDDNALSYPVVDDNGEYIEVNYHDEDGLQEVSFGKPDEYFITKDGVLEIWKDKGNCYTLKFLKVTKVK